MKQVVITQCPQYILDEQAELPIEIPAWVFEERIGLLVERVKEKGLDFAVLYGDREHFANIEYFSRYDCRFEEALLIVSSEGKRWIVVGNEGEAYTSFIPYEIKVLRYRNFSLQGQPRENCPNLAEFLASVGICSGSRIGLAGYKYFEPAITEDGFDVPEYIVSVLRKLVGYENVNEFTRELTGLPHGLRMTVRHPVEVAYIEYKATKVANCIRRMFKALKPGISELELSKAAKIDFSPTQTHSMVNFGPNSLSMGIRSPSPKVYLQRGSVMSFAHSERGSLVCPCSPCSRIYS